MRREVAAVDEDQLRHDAHRLDLGGAEERVVRQDDAADVLLHVDGLAVPGDVHDAPAALEERVHDLAGIRLCRGGRAGEETLHGVRSETRSAFSTSKTLFASREAPGKRWVIRRTLRAPRSPGPMRRRRRRSPARGTSRSDISAAASSGSPTAAARRSCPSHRPAVPTGCRRCLRPARSAFRPEAGEKRFELERNQQVVERPADLRILVLRARRGRDQIAQQPRLRALRPDFGARARRVERIRDRACCR